MNIAIRILFCVILFFLCTLALPAASQDLPYAVFFISDRDEVKYMNSFIPEIYSMNPDGSAQTRLTSNEYREFELEPTKDGEKLAFVMSNDPDYNNADLDIVWMNYAGSFDISPDGKTVFFSAFPPRASITTTSQRFTGSKSTVCI
jgi:hypothetical protein